MNNHFKPRRVKPDDPPLRVILFRSRHKDNQDVPEFVERFESFLSREPDASPTIMSRFLRFVEDGQPGEMSRLYISVNPRDNRKTTKAVMQVLLDAAFEQDPNQGEIDMARIGQLAVSRAALPENAITKRWLLDIDEDDGKLASDVILKLNEIDLTIDPYIRKTPNGYHVICAHGFDVRRLGELADHIDLKRDALPSGLS